MAFDIRSFDPTGSGSGGAIKTPTYKTYDTFATVETDGYFDEVSTNLSTGDLLIISSLNASTTGVYIYFVEVSGTDVTIINIMSTTNSQISSMQSDITTLQNNVSDINTTLTSLQNQIDDLDTRVTALEGA